VEILIPISFFMSVAAVLILRPISKKLGGLVEATARERAQPPAEDPASARTALILEHMLKRLDTIEERLDFTERLVGNRPQFQPQWPDARATGTRMGSRRTDALLEGDRVAG
jgi:hypothetical protein